MKSEKISCALGLETINLNRKSAYKVGHGIWALTDSRSNENKPLHYAKCRIQC